MTPFDYERTSDAWRKAQAETAQDAAYNAHCLDWSRIEMLEASVDGLPIGIWRNCWLEWSDNLIDDAVELVDPRWEDEQL